MGKLYVSVCNCNYKERTYLDHWITDTNVGQKSVQLMAAAAASTGVEKKNAQKNTIEKINAAIT